MTPPSNGKPERKMVKLTINGHEIEVREGLNLIDAAEMIGIEIPHYCYHPGLSIPANCRICQVEIEGQPKLAFACRTPVKDGLVVHTDSEKAKAHQRLAEEFLLSNHPLDCPICDKSGECTLQNYYMEYGRYQPVMIENKYKKHKGTVIGPTIVLDAERCILCSRCVRFCDEVTGTNELGLFNRNNHMEIGVVPGTEVNNAYSGNLVDICPVGALGDRDFRFKCRVWYLRTTKSICPGCSRGCNIVVDHQTQRRHKAHGARIMRLRPRFNQEVNGHWICDEGRYNHRWHDENRLHFAARREGEGHREASVREALAAAVERLKGSRDWTVVLSSHLTNEELFLAKLLFIEGLGLENVFVGPPPQGTEDNILRRADKTPNTAGALALGLPIDDGTRLQALARGPAREVWVCGFDLLSDSRFPLPDPRFLVYQGSNVCPTSRAADIVIPTATCFEKDGTYTNFEGRVQRLWQAVLPVSDAVGDLSLFQSLGAALGVELLGGEAQDVFDALAQREPAFAGLSCDSLGMHGQPLAVPVEAG
jgi:NADH-quinone oxidoreductase subunit G